MEVYPSQLPDDEFNQRTRGQFGNTTVDRLFAASTTDNAVTIGGRWIVAEISMEIRDWWDKWFRWLDSGEWRNKRPDPFNADWPEKRARKLVKVMDDDMGLEAYRFNQITATAGPGFSRLKGPPLIAFAQEWGEFKIRMDRADEDAKVRWADGSWSGIPTSLTVMPSLAGYCSPVCTTPTPIHLFTILTPGKTAKLPDHGDHTMSAMEIVHAEYVRVLYQLTLTDDRRKLALKGLEIAKSNNSEAQAFVIMGGLIPAPIQRVEENYYEYTS